MNDGTLSTTNKASARPPSVKPELITSTVDTSAESVDHSEPLFPHEPSTLCLHSASTQSK